LEIEVAASQTRNFSDKQAGIETKGDLIFRVKCRQQERRRTEGPPRPIRADGTFLERGSEIDEGGEKPTGTVLGSNCRRSSRVKTGPWRG